MAGLQGVGKTTACGKLALYLQKQGKKVWRLLVASAAVSRSPDPGGPDDGREAGWLPCLPLLAVIFILQSGKPTLDFL
jgi:hypothetical protein